MKKILVLIIVFIVFVLNFSFANIEDSFYCTITKNSITVTMNKENNYKCTEYLTVLTQAINTEYNNIMSIQKLIQQGYDIEYWKDIREAKREKLKKIIIIKNQIEKAIDEFDINLFVKIKEYVVYTVSPYRMTYQKALKALNSVQNQGGKLSSDIRKKIDYIKENISVIDNIIQSDDYDTLIKNFNRHLYLKNQIEGK